MLKVSLFSTCVLKTLGHHYLFDTNHLLFQHATPLSHHFKDLKGHLHFHLHFLFSKKGISSWSTSFKNLLVFFSTSTSSSLKIWHNFLQLFHSDSVSSLLWLWSATSTYSVGSTYNVASIVFVIFLTKSPNSITLLAQLLRIISYSVKSGPKAWTPGIPGSDENVEA